MMTAQTDLEVSRRARFRKTKKGPHGKRLFSTIFTSAFAVGVQYCIVLAPNSMACGMSHERIKDLNIEHMSLACLPLDSDTRYVRVTDEYPAGMSWNLVMNYELLQYCTVQYCSQK